MKRSMRSRPAVRRAAAAAILLCLAAAAGPGAAAPAAQAPPGQYLIRLQPIPRLVDPANWTEKENRVVAEHFGRLQRLLDEGTLILAGRTLNEDETMFGIVILEAASEAEARRLMNEDPAVKEGIMTARLFPYRVALIRKGGGSP